MPRAGPEATGLKAALVQRIVGYKPSFESYFSAPPPLAVRQPQEPTDGEECFGKKDLMDGAQPGPEDVVTEAVDLLQEVKKEMKKYIVEPTLPRENSPRLWWKANERRFPLLAVLARDYLSIPGSSSSLERLFSRFGLVVNPRRNRIDPALARMIIFCHENIRRKVF